MNLDFNMIMLRWKVPMNCLFKHGAVFLAAFWINILAAWPQVPTLINYQGRLITGTNLYNGFASVVLALYTNAAPASGETCLYASTNAAVPVVDGLYSAVLGEESSATHLCDTLQNAEVFLQITVNEQVLLPRGRLAASPYALVAAAVGQTTSVGRTQTAWHLGSRGMFGQAVNFAPNYGYNGLFVECAVPDAESAGIFLNGNTLVMWSAGDDELFRFYDQDDLADPEATPKMRLDANGDLFIAGVLHESSGTRARDTAARLQQRIEELEARLSALEAQARAARLKSAE